MHGSIAEQLTQHQKSGLLVVRETGPRRSEQKDRHQGGKPQRSAKSSRAMNLSGLASQLDFDLLAAALGVSEATLRNLASDRPGPRDEQSVAHITERLKEAGLPGSWLHQPSPKASPEVVARLRNLAAGASSKSAIRRSNLKKLADAFHGQLEQLADALEIALSSITGILEGRLDFDDQRAGHINPRLMAAGFPDGWLELADAVMTAELKQKLEAQAVDVYERDLVEMEEARAQMHVNTAPVAPVKQPTAEPEVIPAPAQAAVLTPPFARIKEENEMAKSSQQTLPGMPVASGKSVKAGAPSRPLARGVLGTGRQLSGAKPPFARGGKSTPAAAPTPAPAAKKAAPAAAPAPTVKKAAPRTRPQAVQPPVAAKTTTPPLTKAKSLKRAKALDKLLDNARRSAKITLWRDLVGSSQAYAGNIRRGLVMFRDDLAQKVEEALGLPKGWLDNPVFPPPTLHAWVMDKEVPLPGPAANDEVKAAPAEATAVSDVGMGQKLRSTVGQTPDERAPTEPGKSLPSFASFRTPAAAGGQPVPPFATGGAAAPAKRGRKPKAVPTPAAAPAEQPAAATATPAQAPVAAPAAAPVAAPVSMPQATAPVGFTWMPTGRSGGSHEQGPLTTALFAVLGQLSAQGQFTEDDALRLINYLKNPS